MEEVWPPPTPPAEGPTSRQKLYATVLIIILTLIVMAALSARNRADRVGQAVVSEFVTTVVMTAASDVADTQVNGSS